ncbi:HLX family protein [Megaselia abdita]
MIMMASDSHSQNDEFTVKRSSSVECDSECNDHDQKMDDQNSQQIKKKLNFSVDRLLNSNSRPLVDYSDVKLCAKFENGISLWRPTPIRAMINASICGSDQYHPSYSVLTQAMMLKYQQQQQHHQQHHHHHHHQQSSTNNNNNSSSSNSGPPLSGPPNHQNFRSNNFILAKSLVDVDGGGSGCGSIQNLVPSNGKRKKSWSRAVFSNLQRKGLEIQFQQQKYITKPDRRKLAMRLNLSDSQSL